jgi:hypothetical protein
MESFNGNINIFEDYSKIYRDYILGKITYPVFLNFSLLRLSVMVGAEESIKNDIIERGVQKGMDYVVSNDSFDIILLKEVFSKIENIPPILKDQLVEVDSKIINNDKAIRENYSDSL